MYGISNSQQQGGGGGGAASYKAIKSTLMPRDWQEVAGATPYFVGDDATTWATDSNSGMHIKTNSNDLGIITGQQYTITIAANGVTYSSTATATDVGGMLSLQFQFTEAAATIIMMYDYFDWATKTPGTGSFCAVQTTANSLVITNFSGEGFGTTRQATIADSAIKVNSAVTMYTNTSEKIAVGEKTNGNVTLTAPSVPETAILYSLEIVGTDTEGLFEIVNGYVPDITLPTVPQWHTIYEDTTGTGVTRMEFGTDTFKEGNIYRIALDGESHIFYLPHEGGSGVEWKISIVKALPVVAYNSVTYHIYTLLYTARSIATSYEVRYDVTETGISNYEFSTAPELKFTKIEVYY